MKESVEDHFVLVFCGSLDVEGQAVGAEVMGQVLLLPHLQRLHQLLASVQNLLLFSQDHLALVPLLLQSKNLSVFLLYLHHQLPHLGFQILLRSVFLSHLV
jgi:hypothetical protein